MKEIALITRGTRTADLKEIATSEVVAFQRSQLSPEEWSQLQRLRCQAEAQTMPIQIGQERRALGASIWHLFERNSVLREHEILAEALNQSLGLLDPRRVEASRLKWGIWTGSTNGFTGKPAALGMLHPARFAPGTASSEIRKRHQEHLPRAEFQFCSIWAPLARAAQPKAAFVGCGAKLAYAFPGSR